MTHGDLMQAETAQLLFYVASKSSINIRSAVGIEIDCDAQ